GPNTAGKDRYTMNLTPNGIKALGESDTCSTGWDCGAYILAHHKLFDGETAPAKTEAELKREETNAKLAACAGASTCKISDDLTLSKIGDYWTTPTMTKDQWGGAIKSEYFDNDYWSGASSYCESQGLRLPTVSELQTLRSTCSTNGLGCDGWFWSSELDEGDVYVAYGVSFTYGSTNDYDRYNGKNSSRAVCVGN
ncbi:hypothetical protein IJ732_07175, partial [bacterium]|nr:hypothetical protein [bacterium]